MLLAARKIESNARFIRRTLNDPHLFTEAHQHGTPEGLKAEGLAEARGKLGEIPQRALELGGRLLKNLALTSSSDDIAELNFCVRRMTDVLDGKG